MANEIRFTDVKKAALIEVPEPRDLEEDEVLVETLYSGISTGTEMQFYLGTAPFFDKKHNQEIGLFVKADGAAVKYPLSYGYENVGRIVEVGQKVTDLKVNDVVASYYGHISKFKSKASGFTFLPEEMDPRYGVFMPLLGVAYKNILNARIIFGETVVIFGAGIVGQLLIQLSKLSGAAEVISVDMCDYRLNKALESGADVVLNPGTVEDIAVEVRKLTSNRGADVVFEATGSPIALHQAIRTVYRTGTVFATSFYKGEAKGLFLGEEFHHNHVRIVMSGWIPNEIRPRWNEKRWQDALQTVLPKLKLHHLISNEFPASEAQKAYQLAAERPDESLQIIFSFQ